MNPEDYKDNEVKYITALGSVAHTYGNVLATGQKWFMDIFENNPFKTVHVSSMIAHKQILSTPHEFLKKSKPMIIFRPRIEYGEDVFLGNTLMTQRMGGPLATSTPGVVDLHPFFFDSRNGIDIQYSVARRCMFLDITMIFDTEIQQINCMEYLKFQIKPVNTPFDIECWLEAYLSKEMMEVVSKLSGVPVHDENGSVHDFLEYMNQNSLYPVTYRLAGSTGNEEFYRYYDAKIFTMFTDFDKGGGDSMNHIKTNYTITLTMRMEFWSPGMMYLFSKNVQEIEKPRIPTDSTLIPIFADMFMYEDLNLAPGWKVYSHASYILDKENDVLDYSTLLENSISEVIKYHMSNGIPLVNFLDIKVRKQGELLREGRNGHYMIDYANNKIHFRNRSYGYFTYTIIISIDAQYINDMIRDIFHLA